jgi:hypothetical protein
MAGSEFDVINVVEVSNPDDILTLEIVSAGPQGPAGADAVVSSASVRAAMVSNGDLPVRYDTLQPTIDCLWVAPTGQVVLITGSP